MTTGDRPPHAILTVGLPGCGKSTYAAGLKSGHVEVNLDLLRERVCGDATNQEATPRALRLRSRLLKQLAAKGRDVILSLRGWGFTVHVVFFDVGETTCLARNARRGRQVPEAVIHMMAGFIRENPPTAKEADSFERIGEPEDPLL